MVSDIRIAIDFFDHFKTQKLERLIGPGGILTLQRLWAWTAVNRSKGVLSGMSHEDIELACRWQGAAGKFIESCLLVGFIDKGEPLVVHDWEKHQAWAFNADERSRIASNAANAKHAKTAQRMRPASEPHNTEQAELIYAQYPKKVAKADALKAIEKALKTVEFDTLLLRVSEYKKATANWPEAEKKFIPYPASWFNDARYDDDQSTWHKENPDDEGLCTEAEALAALRASEPPL